MSLSGDSELRIQEGYNGKPVVGLVAGSWGKRLVRNLSSPFREAEKSQEYLDTKKAVLATLVKIYGEELGTRVFRANIGRMQDGVHVVSGYHPITGRHIRQMMEQADQELLRKFADPELGGRRLGRDDTSGPRAPESTRNWMNEQYFGEQDREDDVRVELRSSKVDIKDRPRRDTWGEVAKALQEDLRNRTEQGEKRLFWTLDIGLGGDRGFLVKHPIGIHVDVDQPEQVHVYDGNVRMVTVTREEFAAWLAAHMKHEYKVGTVELHRALPMRNSCFEQKDGVWKREREHTFDGKEIGDWLLENIKKMDLEPELNTCGTFDHDVDRENFRVLTPGRSYVLRSQNGSDVLESLVRGGSQEQTRHGVYNLSVLLNQNLCNSSSDLVANHFRSQIANTQNETTDDRGLVPDGNGTSRSVTITKRGAGIHIDVEMVQPILIAVTPEPTMLDPRSSSLKVSYSIDISLEALRREGGYREFKTSKVDSQVKMLPQQGEERAPKNVAMFRDGDGFVSDRLVGMEEIEKVLHLSRGDELGAIEGDPPKGLTEEGVENLSRLLGRGTQSRIYSAFYKELTGKAPEQEAPEGRTTVSPVILRNGKRVLDIEFRMPVPEDLPNAHLFHGGEYPSDPGRLEFVVSVRVPVDDLNAPVNGEDVPTYDFLHAPQLEWTPNNDEL